MGKIQEAQVAIVEKFAPRYASDALVLYLGDASNKFVLFEREWLEKLGIPVTLHDKLPDIILYHEAKNWLYLIELAISHGPVSHKRRIELEKLLQQCTAKRVYISVFCDFAEFQRHSSSIAWGTTAWIAEAPEHMIHFDSK